MTSLVLVLSLLSNPIVLAAMPYHAESPDVPLAATSWAGPNGLDGAVCDSSSHSTGNCATDQSCVLHHNFVAILASGVTTLTPRRISAVGYRAVPIPQPVEVPEPPPPRRR